jgi:hypothetical protein
MWHHRHEALFRAPMAFAWNPDRCGFTPQPPAAEWHRTQSFCRWHAAQDSMPVLAACPCESTQFALPVWKAARIRPPAAIPELLWQSRQKRSGL